MPRAGSRHEPPTLRERAAEYFGASNVRSMRIVNLGRGRVAFVSPTRMWIYEEDPVRKGIVVNLSEKMRGDLLDALDGF